MLLIEEVADILRCSAEDVLREIESGNLKAFRVAGQWRVLEIELQRFVSGSSPTPDDTRGGGPDRVEAERPRTSRYSRTGQPSATSKRVRWLTPNSLKESAPGALSPAAA